MVFGQIGEKSPFPLCVKCADSIERQGRGTYRKENEESALADSPNDSLPGTAPNIAESALTEIEKLRNEIKFLTDQLVETQERLLALEDRVEEMQGVEHVDS